MMRGLLRGGTICTSLILGGCTNVTVSGPDTLNATGVAYSLPKAQILVTAERKFVTADDVKAAKDAAAAGAALVEAETKALADAKKTTEDADGALGKADAAVKDDLSKKALVAKAVVDYLTTKLAADKMTLKTLSAKADDAAKTLGTLVETASITALPLAPDPKKRFVADLNHEIWREDSLKLTLSNGLLSSSDQTSTDQTGNIIIALAKDAAALSGSPSVQTFSLANLDLTDRTKVTSSEDKPYCKPYIWGKIIDPTDNEDFASASKNLSQTDSSFTLYVNAPSSTADSPIQALPNVSQTYKSDQSSDARAGQGLYYRTATPVSVSMVPKMDEALNNLNATQSAINDAQEKYDAAFKQYSDAQSAAEKTVSGGKMAKAGLDIDTIKANLKAALDALKRAKSCEIKSLPTAQAFNGVVPDSRSLYRLPSKAGLFSSTNDSYVFKDGMLTSFSTKQPSELLAIASLPLDVAKAIISAPTELLQLRVNYDTQAAALTTKNVELLKAQIDLLAQQKALQAAQQANRP